MEGCGIYKITSPVGKIYIGQSCNIKKRWMVYKRMVVDSQPRLKASFIKHGVDSHKFEIVHLCERIDLNRNERYYQELYSVLGKSGLNCTLSKDENNKILFSKESRSKMRNSQLGKKQSAETIEKKRILMTGKKMPAEGVKKSVLKRIGRVHPESAKIRQSVIMKEKYGERFSKEMSIRMRKLTSEQRSARARKAAKKNLIINLETGIFYETSYEAADSIGRNRAYIDKRIHNKFPNKTSLILA